MVADYLIEEEEKEEFEKLQRAYQSVFVNNPDGDVVLMDILNDLGFFATDARAINPELSAFANRLLMKLGVYDTGKGLQRYMNGIIDAAKRSN